MSEFEMSRGDLESQEKGSGARADGGKPDWGLMPLEQIAAVLESSPRPNDVPLWHCVDLAANFQQRGGHMEALDLLKASLYVTQLHLTDDENDADVFASFEEVIRVWEHGQEKYAAFNWMKGMSWNSVLASYMRHIQKLYQGERIDKESGRLHAAHLVCNAMMLVHFTQHYPDGNDLPIRWYK